jgi:hypothetical protein
MTSARDRQSRRARGAALIALVSALVVTAFSAPAQAEARRTPTIAVLSNRADLISGGDALVQISRADRRTKITLNGRDITRQFTVQPDGRYLGLVTGLQNGRNELRARNSRTGARIIVTNHPRGGPVFAGPQVQPWDCDLHPVQTGLGAPVDAQCTTPTVYRYVYRPVGGTRFADYDPASPPRDVATTRIDNGTSVPYVVRLETGVQDRGIYQIATLFDPSQKLTPGRRPAGWNGKVLWPFGGGSAPQHLPAVPGDVLDDQALSRGFMVATSGLNIHGANANTIVSAEAVSMLKEHIVEAYGPIRYTIGSGCSGGSIQQQVIAEQYPGLLNGIQPNCSYPDTWTTGTEVVDCGLLVRYFASPAAANWTAAQKAAVAGTQDTSACAAWNASFVPTSLPDRAANCGWADGDTRVYQPQTNPGGTRCVIQDYMLPVWGRRSAAVWTAPEQAVGRGFARDPADNTGVLYGLAALRAGTITGQQFTDLNTGIGGTDIDGRWQSTRMWADRATTATAYTAGQVTQAYRLDEVPIIDLRGSSNTNDIHTDFHSWELRARLDAANGSHANQVIWTWRKENSPTGIVAPPDLRLTALLTMDTWLSRIEADHRPMPIPAKVLAHRPGTAVDTCWPDGTPQIGLGPAVPDPGYRGRCGTAFPVFADARAVAGEPRTGESLKCALTPLRPGSLPGLSRDQFNAVKTFFQSGICDWTKPPVGYRPAAPWLDFTVGTGGRPRGPTPRSVPITG